MSDAGWLILAVTVGVLAAIGWVKREMWIHRRRQRRGPGE